MFFGLGEIVNSGGLTAAMFRGRSTLGLEKISPQGELRCTKYGETNLAPQLSLADS